MSDKVKEKKPLWGRIIFAAFLFTAVLSAFLFWATKNMGGEDGALNGATTMIAAIISLCLSILLGIMVFIRFLRGKTVAGGLFLTTAASTAVFLGASQFIGYLVPPVMGAGMALGEDPAVAGGGVSLMIMLAQVGLFALWFGFLLLTIKFYVRPVGKINKYLQKIRDGEKIGRVRLGKSKQYKEIAETLREIGERYGTDED